MRRNAWILVFVVASVALAVKPVWRSSGLQGETLVDGLARSLGYKVGSNINRTKIALGTPRAEVEALGNPGSLFAATFPNGVQGMFPSCRLHADRVAYNSANLVVALRGETLTAPNGALLSIAATPDLAVSALGPAEETEGADDCERVLRYPSQGIQLSFILDYHTSGEYHLKTVELTTPWKPGKS